MAQAVHAAFHFAHAHPELTGSWVNDSNYLVIVSVPDEATLLGMETTAWGLNLKHYLVREPDLDNETTAIALAPGKTASRMTSNFPLALKEKVMT